MSRLQRGIRDAQESVLVPVADAIWDQLAQRVELDCSDYGIRINNPTSLNGALESIGLPGLPSGSDLLRQALVLAQPLHESGVIAIEEVEDIFFDTLSDLAPDDIGPFIEGAQTALDQAGDIIATGDLDAIAAFVVDVATTGVDLIADIIDSDPDWDAVGAGDLIVFPSGQTPLDWLANRLTAGSTSDVEYPCSSQVINGANFPGGFSTDTLGLSYFETISVDIGEAKISVAVQLVAGWLADGRQLMNLYLVVSSGVSTNWWPYVGQSVETAPVDFNIGLLASGFPRNQSGEALDYGLWVIGLPIIDAIDQEDYGKLLEVSSFGVSLSHIGAGVSVAFPILLSNETP